jgi:hypothetical protein
MTITREEAEKVADNFNIEILVLTKGYSHEVTPMQLQAFANHFYELGRQKQRESDAAIPIDMYYDFTIAEAISNNTGDLT